MTDPVFLDLMQHYADFQEMGRGTSAPASYGHTTVSRDTVVETTPDIRSRFRSLTADEIMSVMREGETVGDFILYVPYDYLPTNLRQPKNSVVFTVVNIRSLGGVLEEDGPLMVQNVKLMAGEHHHYQIRLRVIN